MTAEQLDAIHNLTGSAFAGVVGAIHCPATHASMCKRGAFGSRMSRGVAPNMCGGVQTTAGSNQMVSDPRCFSASLAIGLEPVAPSMARYAGQFLVL